MELLKNLEKLHTTKLGVERIRKNLSLDTDDVIGWCKAQILSPCSSIERRGKNWYIDTGTCTITMNAYSYTVITAHKQ